ncbi:FtsX-like permease family protein [uncultured Imperialibacter sp.]|uniref:ABC transporter permease n=1 Tax=uncultured Imperialibacter sp. TaxID=1672639 RepID=UPI0030D8FB18|tara:strand:+ start:35615 stop:38017 length:2403 start_codon:yes stop_codon:yes gene_type:complete
MFRNYLVTALRSLLRQKAFSFINIIGLAIGLAACLLIIQYARFELSYEKFLPGYQNVYRLRLDRYNNGELGSQWAAGASAIGKALKEEFPEVVSYARLSHWGFTVKIGDKVFKEENSFFASDDFLKVFPYKVVAGSGENALKEPFTSIITQSTASKYFGEEEAVGKIITVNSGQGFKVTAVIEDQPRNTHLKFGVLVSFATYISWQPEVDDAWWWDGFLNYVKLEEGTSASAFEAKIPTLVEARIGERNREVNHEMIFSLQPLADIHLYSHLMHETEQGGDGDTVYALLGIGFFIILIAWINYVNLATARSINRAREVGVRKVMGSYKRQLVGQFMLESALTNLVAVAIALVIVLAATPYFSELTGQQVSYAFLADAYFWFVLLAFFAGGSILSGLYPSFVLARFQPASVLKGKMSTSPRGILLRKGLVILQMTASVFLMAGTLIVTKQLGFMKSQDLGVDIDQTLVIKGPNVTDSTYTERLTAFKNTLLAQTTVKSMTASSSVPGRQPNWNAGGIRLVTQADSEAKQYRIVGMDYDFIDAYGLEIVAGRKFSKEFGTETTNVIFNETALRWIGFDDPEDLLGNKIEFWGDQYTVIGIAKDYYQQSLKESHEPLIFRLIPDAGQFYSIKLNTANLQSNIEMVKEEYLSSFPGNVFEYFFLDDYFNQQYASEQTFGKVVALFSGLSIFVACLGLIGLTSFSASMRTKEIGIRKVLGASERTILGLLTREFLLLIVISSVLAIPLSWLVYQGWLDNFANRIDLSPWLLLVPGLAVAAVALLASASQTIRAAKLDPAKSLRHE